MATGSPPPRASPGGQPRIGADEEASLDWLLGKPGVPHAVDLALSGRQDDAVQSLARALRGILGVELKDSSAATAAAPEASAEAAASASPPTAPSPEEAPAAGATSPEAEQPERRGVQPVVVPANVRRLTLSALQQLPATCTCIVVNGLHGCGKSAVCNILREVLGGQWLNHDEFASKYSGKNVKQGYILEVRTALTKMLAHARDHDAHVVLVDRCNTLKAHRADITQELRRLQWRKRGGKTLFIDFCHSADGFGYGPDGQLSKRYCDQHVSLCINRIEERGGAHAMLHPGPRMRATVQIAAQKAEAPKPEELSQFDGRVSLDVEETPPEGARKVLDEIRSMGWMPNLKSNVELLPRTELAWTAYRRAEVQWREGAQLDADASQQQTRWRAQCKRAVEMPAAPNWGARSETPATQEEEPAKRRRVEEVEPTPLYWKLDLPEVTAVLSQRGILPASFKPAAGPHAVLLPLGEDSLPDVGAEECQVMREALEALQGEDLEVKMVEIVIEETIAVAILELPPILPCATKLPHVVLGAKPGVSYDKVAALLQEVKAGRKKDGITSIPLPKPRPLTGKLMLVTSASISG